MCRGVASPPGDPPAVGLHLDQGLVLKLVAVGCSTQGAMVFITSSKEGGSLDCKGGKMLSSWETPWAPSQHVAHTDPPTSQEKTAVLSSIGL